MSVRAGGACERLLAHPQGSLVGRRRAGLRAIRCRHRGEQLQFVRKLPARCCQSLSHNRPAFPRHRCRLRQMAVSAPGVLCLEERFAVFLRRRGKRVGRSALQQNGQSSGRAPGHHRPRQRDRRAPYHPRCHRHRILGHLSHRSVRASRRAIGFLFAGACSPEASMPAV